MGKKLDCEFCDIVAGRTSAREVLRTADVVAFFPTEPAVLGHVMIIPTRHMSTIYDVDSAAAVPLATATVAVAQAIHESLAPAGLSIVQSNGSAATQTVPHLHVHVVPREPNDPIGDFWPKTGVTDSNALDETRARLASELGGTTSPNPADPEDRRHHLQLITTVVERLSKASARSKGWAVAVSSAAFGVGWLGDQWQIGLIGLVALLVFLDLDTRYLREERLFIALFRAANESKVAPFDMNKDAFRAEVDSYGKTLRSWSVLRFYLPFLVLGVVTTIGGLGHLKPASDADNDLRPSVTVHPRTASPSTTATPGPRATATPGPKATATPRAQTGAR